MPFRECLTLFPQKFVGKVYRTGALLLPIFLEGASLEAVFFLSATQENRSPEGNFSAQAAFTPYINNVHCKERSHK